MSGYGPTVKRGGRKADGGEEEELVRATRSKKSQLILGIAQVSGGINGDTVRFEDTRVGYRVRG